MTRKTGPSSPYPDDNSDDSTDVGVNPAVYARMLHVPSLLACLIEVLKNAFDWNAGIVRFVTNEGRERLRHIDDGCGMSARNRRGFLSLGYGTAVGDMSGMFGTGAKKFIFTFASNVKVVTAPEDEPDVVYIAEFTPMELATAYSTGKGRFWKSQKKTSKNWPHEHSFGTDITYTLKDPTSRGIHRGAKLAEMLSERLDNVLIDNGMVLVNGERLPAKQLAKGTRMYILDEPSGVHPGLGRIKLEFYHPAKKVRDESLHMTGRAIGEVSFETFVRQLTDDQQDLVPGLFRDPKVCGLITASFLNDHATERRDVYDADISNDERVVGLLELLSRVEADVAVHLGITLHRSDAEETQGKQLVEELIERLQQRYNPDREQPDLTGDSVISEGTTATPPGVTTNPPPVTERPRLTLNQKEFAIDEAITAKLTVPGGDVSGWHFYHDKAHAKLVSKKGDEITLIADERGEGRIVARNQRTGQSVSSKYEVVLEREFKLSSTWVSVDVGATTEVRAINLDKAVLPLKWVLAEGMGTLRASANGSMVSFTPTRSGKASIVCRDSAKRRKQLVCEVVVKPRQDGRKVFRIRDEYFELASSVPASPEYRKLVSIIPAGEGEVHRMVINPRAPGYQTAFKATALKEVLAYAMAYEYAKEFLIDWEDIDPTDLPSVMLEAAREAGVLLDEMLGS